MQAAAMGQDYAKEGVAPLRNRADFQARTNLHEGRMLSVRGEEKGITNDEFAQQAAINSMGRVVDTAVAARNMEGLVDGVFKQMSGEQQLIAREHGYSEDADPATKMHAVFGATQNYQQWGVHDGYRHTVSYDAGSLDQGHRGTDSWKQELGLRITAGYDADAVGITSYKLVGDQKAQVQEAYATGAYIVKSVADLAGLKGFFQKMGRGKLENMFKNSRPARGSGGGGIDDAPQSKPKVVITNFPE